MQYQKTDPTAIFLAWFDTIPVIQQQHLSRLFIFCTTRDSADFALSPGEALGRLKQDIAKSDFPLRKLSQLTVLKAVFDLILHDPGRFSTIDPRQSLTDRKVSPLSERQWRATAASWRRLRSELLTDGVVHAWLRTID